MSTWAIVAGGGTGGHVTPALAVAGALVHRGHDPGSIHFVGSERGVDGAMVPAAGFTITLLPGRGIARRLAIENVGAIVGLVRAFFRALALVARLRPAVVLSVGGYASAPCAFAAVLLRVPLVLAEQNAYPGLVHRLVARFAKASAITFEDTPLVRATLTGNPVRREILDVDRSEAARAAARARLGIPDGREVVGVMTGSLGARRVNDAVLGLVLAWAGRGDVAIYHVIGARDWEEISAAAPAASSGGIHYRQVQFESRMEDLYTVADVMVCRAGAATCSELAVVGVPAVLVPLPIAAEDHQTANALAMVRAGGAVHIPDHELTAERLQAELEALLADGAALAAMGKSITTLGRPDAADRVAQLVEAHARA